MLAHPPRLSLDGICRDYAGQRVVDQLSLTLGQGEVVALLGPSGCGKSTSLRIAAGVDRQTLGTVSINGQVVSSNAAHMAPEHRAIGLMFQDFALFPHLNVARNVAFGLKGGLKAHRTVVESLLERVGLAGFGQKYPHQLSGGEQQRVALVRALAPRPAIVLMDEPFSGLDNRLRDGVREAAFDLLREEGTSVLLVTHEPEEAMRVADRIDLMRGGQIVQSGAPYNIFNSPVDREAAGFFSDINVLHGAVKNAQVDTPFGSFLTPGVENGCHVEIVIRPQHLKLDFDRDGHGPAPTPDEGVAARGKVTKVRFTGNESRVDLMMDHDGTILTATVPAVFMPPLGTPLWLRMRRDRCYVFRC